MRSLKAVAEAKSREQRAIRRTTIFFCFFSYEKEKIGKMLVLFLIKKKRREDGHSSYGIVTRKITAIVI
jgi:hypothetical protein